MASCKLGHVYIVDTLLTKPPKEKYAVCVCIASGYFLWINTNPRPHNCDQLFLPAGIHELVKHDSYLDISKVVCHPSFELDKAKEFSCLSKECCEAIIEFIDAGLEVMVPKHAALIRSNLITLL